MTQPADRVEPSALVEAAARLDRIIALQQRPYQAVELMPDDMNDLCRVRAAIAALQADNERLKAERLKLDRRIHNQRRALRENWEIVEMRSDFILRRRCPSRFLEWAVKMAKELRAAKAALQPRVESAALLVGELVGGLEAAVLQLEYMDERSPTGTTPAIIARLNALIAKAGEQS